VIVRTWGPAVLDPYEENYDTGKPKNPGAEPAPGAPEEKSKSKRRRPHVKKRRAAATQARQDQVIVRTWGPALRSSGKTVLDPYEEN